MAEISLEFYLLALMSASILGGLLVGVYVWVSQTKVSKPAALDGDRVMPALSGNVSKDDLHDTGLRLVHEAAAILKIVQSQIAAGDRFSTSLAEADQKLPKLSDPDQVRLLVKFLVSENAKMQQEQSLLKEQLEQSQSQIEALRFNLAEAEEVSLKDPLTAVANRRALDLSLAQSISEATALKRPLCLVMCDLDHFKKLNDTYGHPVGDEILKIFANVLNENVRQGDTVARYGGEEFAVVLTRTDMQAAARISERIRVDVSTRKLALNSNGQLIADITASFGIAQFMPGDTPATLLNRADAKLYEAKNTGRNRVVIDKGALAA